MNATTKPGLVRLPDPTDLTLYIRHNSKRGELMTDSRMVAVAFGRRHKNVLGTIKRMIDSEVSEIAAHAGLNFEPGSYQDEQGQQRPMYLMTLKGFSELAMSFSGNQSRIIRIRFVNAFERHANAEATMMERFHDLERRELPSKTKGKIGSKLMNERRVEKPVFIKEMLELQAMAQPSLPLQ